MTGWLNSTIDTPTMASKYSHKNSDGTYKILREDVVVAIYDPATETLTYTSKDYEKYSGSVESEVKEITAEANAGPTGGATGPTPDLTDRGVTGPGPTGGTAPAGKSDAGATGATSQNASIAPGPTGPVDLDENARLRSELAHVKGENARLRDDIAKLRQAKSPNHVLERFADPVDLTDAPAQDPNLGDLTPAFVDWARENWEEEIFRKRYAGRLKGI